MMNFIKNNFQFKSVQDFQAVIFWVFLILFAISSITYFTCVVL